MFFGAFFGLISAVAIYHLLMYAVLRAPEFLSYGAYLVALTIFQLGREPKYLAVLGISVDANQLFWWSFSLLSFMGYWLFRSFLMLRTMQPRLERIFFALTCVFAALAPFAPWAPAAYITGMEGLALGLLVVAGWALVVAALTRCRRRRARRERLAADCGRRRAARRFADARHDRRTRTHGRHGHRRRGQHCLTRGGPDEILRCARDRDGRDPYGAGRSGCVHDALPRSRRSDGEASGHRHVRGNRRRSGAARYLHGRAIELAASDAPWEGVDQAAK